MPFSKENTYTTDYIYSLPEGQRAELIDGVIYDMAPPNRLHQELVMNLREFDTLKCKKVPQSLEIGLFFCQIFIFII